MRTTKLFTSVIAALSLMYSSGCCDSDCYYPQPVGVDCPPVAYSAPTVTYEPGCPPPVAVNCQPVVECPPPRPVKVKKPKKVKYSRKRVRCYVPDPCDPCASQYYPTVAYAGTATLLTNPGYVPAVTVAPAARRSEVAGNYVTVLQRGRKGRRVVDRKKTVKTARPVAYTAGATVGPVYTLEPAPVSVTSEPYTITPLSPAPAEPVKIVEPVEPEPVKPAEPAEPVEPAEPIAEAIPEPVVQEPAYAKYLDADVPAAFVTSSPMEPAQVAATLEASPALPLELVPGMVLESPLPAVQSVQQPIMQPVVIQPIIQPVVNPAQQQMAVVAVPGSMQMPAAQVYGQVAAPMTPPMGSWVEGGLVSSAYCPPEICPVPNTSLCAPGMNLSECFTLSENQLLNSPQIYTPDALNPLMPLAPTPAPVAPMTQVRQAPAPVPAMNSKYAALTPPPDITRDARRPEVSMPGPLGGDNVPVVPGAAEIESMLDAMVPPPNLK